MNTAIVRVCPFCEVVMIGDISAHMERCSIEDASRKLAISGDEDSLKNILSSINAVQKAFTFIDFYDRVDDKARSNMFVCENCYCSVINFNDVPYLCKECGGKMAVAHNLIKKVR